MGSAVMKQAGILTGFTPFRRQEVALERFGGELKSHQLGQRPPEVVVQQGQVGVPAMFPESLPSVQVSPNRLFASTLQSEEDGGGDHRLPIERLRLPSTQG